MSATKSSPRTAPEQTVNQEQQAVPARPWRTIVWNDPVNLMSYVTYVFRSYFGYSKAKAHSLMLQVHHDGSAVVAEGSRETMEVHVQAMHTYGLWATLSPQQDG
ncbi:ATP-dependent Clp protease adapter ClpS [Georgenia sunbinii]|uniref:ATP-dependent Clp protease adapter ClpS n=1 Tax=Georgenia sunbinii TaxID=3117728 RepID=UPI002F269B2F